MSRIIFYPYKIGSQSASRLAEELRSRGYRSYKVYSDRKFKPRRGDLIINWGTSAPPAWVNGLGIWVNVPTNVKDAGNKLTTFKRLKVSGVSIPEFTTDIGEADGWRRDGSTVVCRALTRGSGGAGIHLISGGVTLPVVPLYVKYIKKQSEFRVHVGGGKVIDIQQKRRKHEVEEIDYQIRSHDNGWVFSRNNVDNLHPSVCEQSVKAVASLGLDFGAVDVIWNNKYQSAYVLEVNTAPGLEGTTIINYANFIEEIANGT